MNIPGEFKLLVRKDLSSLRRGVTILGNLYRKLIGWPLNIDKMPMFSLNSQEKKIDETKQIILQLADKGWR